MKAKLKILLGVGLLFLLFQQTAEAQILQSKIEILKNYGEPFSEGVTKGGENYLFYKIPVTTKNSGTYEQRRVMFFKKGEDGTETCYRWKIIEPSSETIYNVSAFSRDLVQIGDMQWKDYGKGIIYEVKEVKGVCKITAWYDNKVDLAKAYKM